jgi:beta-lactamase superfamily II metal-dependent hydrolase
MTGEGGDMRFGPRAALGSALVPLVSCLLVACAVAGDLEVHCLNVGNGDCTLVISPIGRPMMIDSGWDYTASSVRAYMIFQGVGDLDYHIATHYHADHIGGIVELVDAGVDIQKAAYDRGWSYTTQTYSDYVAAVGSRRTTIAEGDVIDLGGGPVLRCIGLNGAGYLSPPFTAPPHDENALSVITLLSYREFDLYVAGDLLSYIEEVIAYDVGDVEVYQVDHHGFSNASSSFFVEQITPEVSVISGADPDPSIVARLDSLGDVYITGEVGTIPIETDGYSYSVMGSYLYECDDLTDITVSLNPTRGTRLAPGDSLTFRLSMCNRMGTSQTFYVGTKAVKPGGIVTGWLLGPTQLTLAPGHVIDVDLGHKIPAGAPAGRYRYRAYVGTPPENIIDLDEYEFDVVARNR